MLKNIKAVFFDLDGTLIDSMHVWKDIDIEFLGRFGFELSPTLQKEIMDIWNEMAFQKYSEEIDYKPGAFEFLKLLKKKGIHTAICTSNSRELVNAAGRRLGFIEYFDEIISSGEMEKGKPAPDIYLEAARRVGAVPEECLVFEDVCAGICAGKSAGMKVCAVADPFSEEQWEEKKAMADYDIEDYLELIDGYEV